MINEGRVRFSVHIPADVHEKMSNLANQEGTSLNGLLNEILESWFFEAQDKPITVLQKLERIQRTLDGYDFT